MTTNEPRKPWKQMGWPMWEEEVGKAWEANRSRFATPWEDVLHHDRVSILRVLMAEEEGK